jgi:hypothetical protein
MISSTSLNGLVSMNNGVMKIEDDGVKIPL